MANTPLRQGVRGGYQAAKELLKNLDQDSNRYKRNVFYDPEFKQGLQTAGINIKETPGAFLGAYAARLGADLTTDELRSFYWGMSHPAELADRAFKATVDPKGQLGRYGRGIVALAAVQPALALTGAYNPLNIGELGRPTGYKQNEPDPEDPTKTTEPATELFQRFFQGRTGRPLAYEKAKEEIPDLTKQRYANYMNFLYNDPGPIGKATMGLVKVTPENLQGDPEARILGYPVSIPSVGALAGGIAGARIGVTSSPSVVQTVQPSLLAGQKAEVSRAMTKRTPSIVRGLAGGAVGSAAGAIIGTLTNQAIAAAGNSMSKLPTQQEYQNISAGRI
jgi:hypothetical protein